MPDNLTDIAKGLADVMKRRFTPPEFIPGCKVVSVDDVDQYAANNGWIEAICGQHNQQRCRWRGQYASIAVDDYVDVMYFPDRRLFEVHRQGGSGALSATGNVIGPGSSTDKAIALWNGTAGYTVQDSGVTVDDSDNISTAGDIFPQSSTNGLNTRFERLFGDNVPGAAYQFTRRQFITDNVANNRLGFETDSYPYVFSSPFSSAGPFVWTRSLGHWYWAISNTAGAGIVKWSSATGKTNNTQLIAFGPISSTSDILVAELRVYDTQTPGAGDEWVAVRFGWYGTTNPDMPLQVSGWYGTGVTNNYDGSSTISLTDGTQFVGKSPLLPGLPYWLQFLIGDAGGSVPFGSIDLQAVEGFRAFQMSSTFAAGYPLTFNVANWYISPNIAGNNIYFDDWTVT